MTPFRAAVAMAFTLTVLSACPPTPNTNQSSSTSSSSGSANIPDAAVDLDAAMPPDASACLANEVRDGFGVCHAVCRNPGECAPTETCNMTVGFCVPLPVVTPCNPARCAAGTTCPNPDAGVVDAGADGCVDIPGYCAADNECSIIERCDNNRCISRAGDIILTCGEDAGCPLLTACTFGVCTGCVTDIQCSLGHPGARCITGACVYTGALGPAGMCLGMTCPTGQRCNVANGLCEATCQQNSDCADAGEICAPVINQCVTDFSCSDDAGCTAGLTCVGQDQGPMGGVCVGCNDTTPCGPGLTCLAGACWPDLAATACTGVTCGMTESCDPLNGACYPTNGRCMEDTDCRDGHTCNLLRICSGCSVDSDCRPGQNCFIGSCLPPN